MDDKRVAGPLGRLAKALALAGVCALIPGGASAQSYPDKPIRLVIPFAAGGSNDIIGRIVGQKLGENLGVPVVVENRPGAGGVIGSDTVAKAAPDGYTLLIGATSTMAVNPGLYKKMPFNPLTNLTPISQIASGPFVMAVPSSLPVKSVQEFIDLARAKPGGLNFGSSGNGTSLHLTAEKFKSMAHIDITHIPYKGAAPALVDMVAGQIQLIFSDMAALGSHVNSGQLRALAVTSAKRSPALPGLPTISESGVPGYVATSWYGLLGPAGLPRNVVSRLNAAVAKIGQSEDIKQKFTNMGIEPVTGTPDEFKSFMAAEIKTWGEVIKSSGAQVD